ncbi:ExbD/TolR family protein [Sphingomonas sp.]|uniref:ExbD/TolR family protein n=1 Tax=Sphingomonas sp. TaxID=28214 RepID=UPI003AFFF18D
MRRPVPAYAAAIDEGRPIADLNMTPLIDVLLVLIVMFILLVPTITNEVPITLPGPSGRVLPVTTHRLAVSRAGAVTLDGAAMSDAALAARLAPVGRDEQATLVMATDPAARYERFVQVLAVVKRAGVTRLGFEGLSGPAF